MDQAGFRSREEAVAQSTALYEVLRRREIVGDTTFVTFIDLKKAYDTVPHEALFAMLERGYGFGRESKLMSFLRSLYRTSLISIDTPDGSS